MTRASLELNKDPSVYDYCQLKYISIFVSEVTKLSFTVVGYEYLIAAYR